VKITEKDIQNTIIDYLRIRGIFCWQNDSVGIYDPVKKVYRKNSGKYKIPGVSDILGIYKSKPLAIEVKTAKGKTTQSQDLFLERFQAEGGIAFVARSIKDVEWELFSKDGDP
jgi:hypothetical protein